MTNKNTKITIYPISEFRKPLISFLKRVNILPSLFEVCKSINFQGIIDEQLPDFVLFEINVIFVINIA